MGPAPVWANDEQPAPQYLDALGLSDDERAAFVDAFDSFRANTIAQARSFYVELGGDPAVAEAIDPSELVGIVYGKTDLDTREESRIALGMERAGLAQAPADERPASERLLRWDADLGNAFERSLAETFGAERAQALREARGGWPGKRTTWADLCSERKSLSSSAGRAVTPSGRGPTEVGGTRRVLRDGSRGPDLRIVRCLRPDPTGLPNWGFWHGCVATTPLFGVR